MIWLWSRRLGRSQAARSVSISWNYSQTAHGRSPSSYSIHSRSHCGQWRHCFLIFNLISIKMDLSWYNTLFTIVQHVRFTYFEDFNHIYVFSSIINFFIDLHHYWQLKFWQISIVTVVIYELLFSYSTSTAPLSFTK